MKNTGIIIQARTGSTRLPEKMLMEFYNGASLIEIIIQRIKSFGINAKIILATTTNKKDDVLQKMAEQQNIFCFRGSEEDVLNRFISAAEEHHITDIVRVCADNPFIDGAFLIHLLNNINNSEYSSFFIDENTPVIKTHYGFFAEFVKVSALKKVALYTTEPLYKEHVTNFIYSHPEHFSIHKISPPDYILTNKYIRLTIDTKTDFELCKNIYAYFCNNGISITAENITSYVNGNKEWVQTMYEQIKKN